ncbi:MAG: ROK family protein [Abitibacteriaceae bacterium]|nr:ROK family protein [Abditibacteriaceae bacterium]
MQYAIGIDLGGTNIKTVAVTKDGDLLAQATDLSADDRVIWAERIRGQISRIEAEQNGPAEWVGLSAPGLAAPDGRSIAWMQGRLESVQGLDWTDYLQWKHPIPVLNDAHAALLGEVWKGAAIGYRDVILLTLGTGVGGGILSDGRLLKGHIGRAGHLGHISLNPYGEPDIVGTPGSLEDAIGDCTVALRSRHQFDSTETLVGAYKEGDDLATEIWLRSVRYLGAGLISLINVIDPEVVILGGGMIKAGAALFGPLEEILDAYEWRPTGGRVRLLPAALGEFAGAYGAAYHALNINNEVSL